jgi:putative ABC transport system ATP-binding protein
MIKAHGLRKLYANGDNTLAALDEVSFEVERGEFIVILGASGSGKTTLLNVISGLEKADRGYIDVGGVELQTLSEEERTRFRREHVGIIFQKFNLIPELSVFDNIILPSRLVERDVKEEEVLEIVEELGIREKLFLMPGILSGGEQQRVAIARALYTRPSVILADEPTGNLDSKNGEDVIRLMKSLGERYRQTILLVTHDERIARVADRIFQMKDGKLSISDGVGLPAMDNGENVAVKGEKKFSAIGGKSS